MKPLAYAKYPRSQTMPLCAVALGLGLGFLSVNSLAARSGSRFPAQNTATKQVQGPASDSIPPSERGANPAAAPQTSANSSAAQNAGQVASQPASQTQAVEPTATPTPMAPDPDANNFQLQNEKGIKAYREQKFADASHFFSQAAKLHPDDLGALTNWGLSEAKLGHNFLSLALLRRVQYLDPDFSTPEKASDFVFSTLTVKDVPHEITWMENLHTRFLAPKSLNSGLLLCALFLAISGWLLLSSMGRRKRAFKAETEIPSLSAVGIFFFLLFILGCGWSALKIYDLEQNRATILKEKIALMSAPDDGSVALLDLYGGLQVIVENHSSGDWIQVYYPGAVAGWVHKSDILVESDPPPYPN